MAKKIIITGANGQLGKAFQQILPDVIFVDQPEIDLLSAPTNITKEFLKLAPDIVINCAAYTAVDKAETEIDTALHINALATAAIATACKQLDTQLIQISTDYVLADGRSKQLKPKAETAEVDPMSIYGYSKYLGETAAAIVPRHCIIRTSWIFGDGNNFVKTMLKLGQKNEFVSVVDDQVGRPTYALDLATAITRLINIKKLPQLIHIQNSGTPVSWAGFAKKIFKTAGLNTKVKSITTEEFAQLRGKDNPTAIRPYGSVFDMKYLNSLKINMRSWPEALNDYIKSLNLNELV